MHISRQIRKPKNKDNQRQYNTKVIQVQEKMHTATMNNQILINARVQISKHQQAQNYS